MSFYPITAGNGLSFLPERSGYAYNNNSGLLTVEVEGGLSKSRADFVGGGNIVDVTYQLTADEYEFFMIFYNTIAEKGAAEIVAPLILDGRSVEEYTCKFVPNSVQMSEPNGSRYIVNCQLEVQNSETGTRKADFYYLRETLQPNTTWSYLFNGTDERTEFPAVTVSGSYTACFWMNWDGKEKVGVMSGGELVNGDAYRSLIAWENNVTRWYVAHFGATGSVFLSNANSAPILNTWTHFCIRRSASNITLFRNGVEIETVAAGSNPALILRMLGYASNNDYWMGGKLRDVRVYNHPFNQDNVDFVYSDGATGTAPPVDARFWYRCNEGAGNESFDLSPNNIDAVITSADLDTFHSD